MTRELQTQLSPASPPTSSSPSMPPTQPSAFGTPYTVMHPPSPPSLPPPPDGISFSFFIIVAVSALIAACAFFICQWIACSFIMPAQDARVRRAREAQKKRRAAEEARQVKQREQRLEAEELAQMAPPPRVRTASWIGPLEHAAKAPPEDAPPPHKPSRRVHPSPPPSDAYTKERDGYSKDVGTPMLVSAVLCSPFVIGQAITGGILGFGIGYGLFTLVLGAGGPYALISTETMLMLCALPPLSAFFTPLFMPLGMPEAAARRWLGYVEPGALPLAFMCMPFLQARRGVVRLLLLGVFASALWIPAGYLVLAFALTPPYAAPDLALFAGLYMLAIGCFVMPLGILGFCIEPNFERVMERMSSDPNKMSRFVKRISSLFLC